MRDLKSKLQRRQHNIRQNVGATRSSHQISEKSKKSVIVRPLHHFSRTELTKRMREISDLLGHPGVRPHPHGRCLCMGLTLVSSPSPSEIERTDRELLGSQAKNEVKVEEKQKRGKPKADRNTQGVSPHRTKVKDQLFS